MNILRTSYSSLAALLVALSIAPVSGAQAQSYPTQPVTVIVPFPAGGTTDVVARLVTSRISTMWGQSIVIENQGGASGMIGTKKGATAKPDGYTLTLGNNQTHATNSALFSKSTIDLTKDVTPIAMLTRTKQALVVPKSSPFNSLSDLITAGKKKPLNYASSSVGSSAHLVSESLSKRNGMTTTNIAYRGAAPAIVDLLGGHVDFMIATYGSSATYISGGDLRALAISGEERAPELPNVPTFNELGMHHLSLDSWVGLFAPAGTPQEIVQKWSSALDQVMKEPAIKEKLTATGFEAWFKPASEMQTFHPAEVARWGALVKEAGVALD